jgi:hypothetical protein
MFGATMANIWKTGLTADARYSKFDSSFGSGTYRTFTLSRDLGERLRLDLQGGQQAFTSPLVKNNSGYFTNLLVETDLGSHYFVESTFTTQRGGSENYNQWTSTFGFRFDNRSRERMAAHASKP